MRVRVSAGDDRKRVGGVQMFDNLKDFEWEKCPDGYLIEQTPEIAEKGCITIPAGRRMIPRSSNAVACQPLRNSKVYKAFSEVSDEEDLLSFAKHYGSLTVAGGANFPDEFNLVGIHAYTTDGRIDPLDPDCMYLRLLRKGDGVDEMLGEAA